MRPLNDFILIEPIPDEYVSEAGLIKPEMSRDLPVRGIVIACGPGRYEYGRLVPVDVKAGDRVSFGKFAGVDLVIDDVEYKVMREEEIMGILQPDSVPDATGDSVCA